MNTLEKLRDESHGRCHTISEWSDWLMESGFAVRNSRVRKKPFDFPVWVRRTNRSEEQVEQVERHITSATEELRLYIGAVQEDERVRSIHINVWMVLAEKETE
ncbi:hypothetical protein [Paenibacillus sp. YYML68]|uniref:hypothetical protein n=1 Tax=Paenibacillus sp. YYML68 TaxID=2909250 RepID=UPI0024902CE4|nr:hypothetical protein [Paenibacillus sp. YYML68]